MTALREIELQQSLDRRDEYIKKLELQLNPINKNVEDLTYEDFKEISNIVPKKMTLNDMKKVAGDIAEQFNLTLLDATASLFIAFTMVNNESIAGYEEARTRRVEEAISQRD